MKNLQEKLLLFIAGQLVVLNAKKLFDSGQDGEIHRQMEQFIQGVKELEDRPAFDVSHFGREYQAVRAVAQHNVDGSQR